jgi:5-oxoprolinase (ATP-hydrolysing) subunit C
MSLTVLEPGLYTLVVDEGRPRSRSLGVPVGGAADRVSLALGNALLGNDPGAASLECTLAGPTLRAECDLAGVLYGAPFVLRTDREELTAGTTFTLRAGEVLRIGGTATGARAYLCVRGGLQTPMILGSRSGLAPVQAGDELPCLGGTVARRFIRPAFQWDRDWQPPPGTPASLRRLRVVPGPQRDWFQPELVFYTGTNGSQVTRRVTTASNRMGLRLQGPPLPVPDRELVSEPVSPGAVQVTRDGQCIVLGVDGQTIGGYPKAAQVIAADLDLLGQLRPGEEVAFAGVSLAEAETLYRARADELRAWLLRLRAAAG